MPLSNPWKITKLRIVQTSLEKQLHPLGSLVHEGVPVGIMNGFARTCKSDLCYQSVVHLC